MAEPSERALAFDALYRRAPDPWGFETSAYERAKYAATLGALPRARYGAGLEIGCSIGVLSLELARRCESLLALDVSDVALARARGRPGADAVEFRRAEVPRDWPAGPWDLVVLSEVLYFLDAGEIERTAELVARDLAPGGGCILVNWTGENDRPLDGTQAALHFAACALREGMSGEGSTVAEHYRIDLLSARPGG